MGIDIRTAAERKAVRNPTFKISLISDSPPARDFDWTDAGVEGCYKFICRVYRLFSKFEDKIKQGGFIEHAQYCGNYYGTPKDYVEQQLEAGKDVILEIEIQGALNVKKQFPDVAGPLFERAEKEAQDKIEYYKKLNTL